MINRLVDLSLKHRYLVLGLYLALGGWGYWALRVTPIDAIPDLSDNQVIVFTDWPGHSPQEVEDQVTYPLTTNLQGLAGVRVVRSQSAFGFSMIYVIFDDDTELYFARTRVLERLSLASKLMPDGVVPTLGPDATGVGHVFWYTVESDTHSLRELRTIQDWYLRYQLNAVPGVAEVASIGGHVKQYQIDIDPNRLRGYGISLGEVAESVRNSNQNVGGNVLEASGSWTIVRGVGLIESVEDVENIVVGASAGVPVFVKQVGTVQIGNAFRISSLVKGKHEAVGGVIVARSGVNTSEVIDRVKARIMELAPGLPAGVSIVPFYDRSELIAQSISTLRIALLEEVALVTLAHVIFLMHFRSILIVTLPLPLAVLASFLGMYWAGVTSNIMSLAGIAIAIGVLVDAGIVVTENAFRFVERQGIDTRDRGAVTRAVRESTRLVGRPVFFSMAIILLAFVPVFALTGQEGKLFHPLAFTKTLAVLAATVMAVTLVPVLCSFLLGGHMRGEEANPVMRALRRIYSPVLDWALANRVVTVALAALLFTGALAVGSRIGSEFMPPLNEGDLLFMPIADPSISLEQSTDIAARQNHALMQFPEVAQVVAKVGRADTSTDPSPLNMTETIVQLKPRSQWRVGMTIERLRADMDAATRLPGVANIWTMPIINRIDMLTTGVRSEVGVKVLGSDLQTLDETARRIADLLRGIPGASNVYPEPVASGQYLDVHVDRAAAARHGLSIGAVQEMIETAVGENVLTTTIEGRQRFPVRVRYAPQFRSSVAAIGDTLVATPGGAQVPLRDVARIEQTRGPSMISSENGLLLATVLLNVQGRDVGGFVEEAKAHVARNVVLPPGYYVGWSGRYENQARARARIFFVMPIVLAIIFLLLVATYRSFLEAAHVLLAVPFALTGGVYLVYFLGYNFSVAVWVGFIALFGTAVQTGVVMVIYLEEAVANKLSALGRALTRRELREAVREGALLRLRPKVMTVSTVVAGLLPIMWSTRVGAEVMKPLAAPVLGGMVSSLLHVLIVTPVIFYWLRERQLLRDSDGAPPPDRTGRTGALGVPAMIVAGLTLVALLAFGLYRWQRDPADMSAGTVIQTVASDVMRVSLRSGTGGLHQGRNSFAIEFRDAEGALVDVGPVVVSAVMAMPGMVMSGGVRVEPSGTAGRYHATGEFEMAGAWRFRVDWNNGGGPRSATFEVTVQ
ncbi:CusA/CzcA family heavy metal efflux RND transporter [soil metagenome]